MPWRGSSAAKNSLRFRRRFLAGQPLGDRLGRGGPVAHFAETEEKKKRAERGDGAREDGKDIGDRPPTNEECETGADAEPLDPFSGEERGDGVGDEELVEDRAVVFVGELQISWDSRCEDGERLAVHVVEDGSAGNQRDAPSAEVWDAKLRGGCSQRSHSTINTPRITRQWPGKVQR